MWHAGLPGRWAPLLLLSAGHATATACLRSEHCDFGQWCDVAAPFGVGTCVGTTPSADDDDGSRMTSLQLLLIISMSTLAVVVIVALILFFWCRKRRRVAVARGEPSITFFRLQDPLPDGQTAVNGNATLERDFAIRPNFRMDDMSLEVYPK